jgi:hypothetical protein
MEERYDWRGVPPRVVILREPFRVRVPRFRFDWPPGALRLRVPEIGPDLRLKVAPRFLGLRPQGRYRLL